jgi:hypothetical protein
MPCYPYTRAWLSPREKTWHAEQPTGYRVNKTFMGVTERVHIVGEPGYFSIVLNYTNNMESSVNIL